jgi:tetratricopeptide (TPR) repeat protein
MACRIFTKQMQTLMTKLIPGLLILIIVSFNAIAQTADDYFAEACQYTVEGNYSKAIKYYTKTIETDASFGYAYLNRASTYILAGKQSKALTDIQFYLKNIDSTSTQAMEMRGILLVEEDKFKDAIADLKIVFDKNPESTYLNYYLGISYFGVEEYSSAIQYFSLYLTENPEDWESCFYLAKSYFILKNNSKAIEYSNKFLSLIENEKLSSSMKKMRKDVIKIKEESVIVF